MSDREISVSQQPAVEPEQKALKPITWDFIGRMSKAEYAARREEVQYFMNTHTDGAGRTFK